MQAASSALPCDFYHHYYHYQASAQYLWLAEAYAALDMNVEATEAYDKALFQDHFNDEATEGKARILRGEPYVFHLPAYAKHPITDEEFRLSTDKTPNSNTRLHDNAIGLYLSRYYSHTLSLLENVSGHSNICFLKGRCWFALKKYEKAIPELLQAIRLSHAEHDAYHQFASNEHLRRGERFFYDDHIDLAIADFTKAIDLNSNNKDARKARAAAYSAKGNKALAREDEELLEA